MFSNLLVIKLCFSSSGNPNASIPTPQPVRPRPMFGAFGAAIGANSVVFVSQVSEYLLTVEVLGRFEVVWC